jgi:magnesium chelatase subunit I
LPDLAERIQVAMLNVMEERDIQIRGYVMRLPLDVLVVASANPEDYTNRGRIITPSRTASAPRSARTIRVELDDEVAVIRQEAHLVAEVPDVTASRSWPGSPAHCAATSGRPALRRERPLRDRRARRRSRPPRCTAPPCRVRTAVARVVDLETAVDVLGGKIEFETGEEGREAEILTHLLRTATARRYANICAAST